MLGEFLEVENNNESSDVIIMRTITRCLFLLGWESYCQKDPFLSKAFPHLVLAQARPVSNQTHKRALAGTWKSKVRHVILQGKQFCHIKPFSYSLAFYFTKVTWHPISEIRLWVYCTNYCKRFFNFKESAVDIFFIKHHAYVIMAFVFWYTQ